MKNYKIEKGIKIPPPRRSNGSAPTLVAATMRELQKGQSFLIKDAAIGIRAEKIVREFNQRERARDGKRAFVSRRVSGGVRVWRAK